MNLYYSSFRAWCLLFLVSILWAACEPAFAAVVGIRLGNTRFSANVQSMFDIRWKNLTHQGWDMSCGAAALSTLLTYHHRQQLSEMAITLTILKNSDPALVRKRGGFSLYDLKRFVRAVGLEGLGYGDMTIDDLEHFDVPAILPIQINNFDHFVIFRKRFGNHILLGDPAFGNISMPIRSFEEKWGSRIAFYVVNSEEQKVMAKLEKARARSPLSPEAMEMAIPDLNYGARIVGRIPSVPLTRRMKAVTP